MSFTIEYGPKGTRTTVLGLKIMQVVPKAEALIGSGAEDVRIIGPGGKPSDLPQFKLDLGRIII